MVEEGDRVHVKNLRCTGRVCYVGHLHDKEGIFYGVELSKKVGKNDGSFQGRAYFRCAPGFGIFVRQENISRLQSSAKSNARLRSAAYTHDRNDDYMRRFETGLKRLNLDGDPISAGADHVQQTPTDLGINGNESEYQSSYITRKVRDFGAGPVDPRGIVFDASDRPLLCLSLSPDGSECVVGGSDHGLRVFEVCSGKELRNLYGKHCGHSDWVTAVSFCPDGSLISAGMDKKLCWWEKKRAACVDLEGHTHSVSKVKVSANDGGFALSSSYDKTLRLWSLKRSHMPKSAFTFRGHTAPVLDFCFANGHLLSGDRSGNAIVWDLTAGCSSINLVKHRGHVTALHAAADSQTNAWFTGDQSGTLRAWDFRRGPEPIHEVILHPGGAVNEVAAAAGNLVVTAGADKVLCISDCRKNFQKIHSLQNHKDFIYSMRLSDRYVFSGSGDGMLLVHELSTGRLMYGLGANEAGVRCIECRDDVLVAAGDDGNAIVYTFA